MESRKEKMKGYSPRSLYSSDTEYRSSRYLGNLGDLPGVSNDKDELQAHAKMIRIRKYLEAKAAIIALNALYNFSGYIYVEKTSEQCNFNHHHSRRAKEDS